MARRINVWLDGKIQKRMLITRPFGNHTMYLVRHNLKEQIIDAEFPYDINGKKVYALSKAPDLGFPLWRGV
jgi:hypothetical protein